MAHPVVITPRQEAALNKVRPLAMALPEVEERISHGSPTFFTGTGTKARIFVSVHDERDYFEGRLCLWAASPKEIQADLVEGQPDRFFIPPYVGPRGWIGLRLDLPKTDWDEVAGVIEDAHSFIVGG